MSHLITIKNTLLEPKHFKAMGGDRNIAAIWLYIWLLDKMTKIDPATGKGKIWGGKPVVFEDVEKDLGISRATYKRWLALLKEGDYIDTLRTPRGLVISVNKAYKIFGQSSERRLTKEPSQIAHPRAIDGSPKSHHYATREPSNIRQYKDNTKTKGDSYKKERQKAAEVREILAKRGIVKPIVIGGAQTNDQRLTVN